MIDTATQAFIDGHRQCDVRQLALQARSHGDVDMAVAVSQIAGWQKARNKIPSWATCDGIVYPPHLSMEQCSSEQTARYKQRLCQRLLQEMTEGRHTSMADLTGGFGVDFAFLCPLFDKGVYIEQQKALCDCARHNFHALGIHQAEVVEGDGTTLLHSLPHQQLIFVDPARRDHHGGRTFAIADCTPDVLLLLSTLLQKADIVMLKLSPMLDWHHTLESLEGVYTNSVREMHIVATGNECKELLVVLSAIPSESPLKLFCADDDQVVAFSPTPSQSLPIVDDQMPLEGKYLYEPGAAVMKSGCFSALAHRYGITALHANSHLFVSEKPIMDFPGRQFVVRATTTMNKRQLRQQLAGLHQANITVRNFPMTVAELRKRLKLADGGDTYIFATTTLQQHLLLVCEKIKVGNSNA